MNFDRVKQIADAVLYEGYIRYPYRASAMKNRQRFDFGVLSPRLTGDVSMMRTECLVEGDLPVFDVCVRCLHQVSRDVFRPIEPPHGGSDAGTAKFEFVPSLKIDGHDYYTWREAVEREVTAESLSIHRLLVEPHDEEFIFEQSQLSETLHDARGNLAGQLVRRHEAIEGAVTVRAESLSSRVHKLIVQIENGTSIATPATGTRSDAQMRSLISTHTILGVRGGGFVSLSDPPEPLATAAATCDNVGTWPVLVGDDSERDMMLSSPIILYDHPRIAPESEGDFFDGLEMDEMLALRVMTLTDDEKQEMQQTDDRARQILERTESLPPEKLRKLHGVIRGLRPIENS